MNAPPILRREVNTKYLEEVRKNANLSRKELADLAEITKMAYYYIEKGFSIPTNRNMKKICSVLNFYGQDVFLDDLFPLQKMSHFSQIISENKAHTVCAGSLLEDIEKSELREKIMECINSLDKTGKATMEMYFGFNGYSPQVLQKVGDAINCTRGGVHYIKKTVLKEFKCALWQVL